ncbi:MAG: sugar phosphate isomerase/epimerase [bacterium]|nr:sugar phosphate isomerase/epimerase [bacterium]
MDLCPGRIGVATDQRGTIDLAAKYGFESVEPNGGYIAGLSGDELGELLAYLEEKQLVWGAAGLPVEFRQQQAKFEEDIRALPKIAKALQSAGVTRIGTWLMPAHDELTYLENFKQHTQRLTAVAKVLADYNLALGLEYVGPRTLWSSKRYAFIHSMRETKELIGAIGTGNVGFVLDSWHWYTAEESEDDLMSVTAEQIVAVDLNDAPKGIPVEEQIDNRRELPAATGVIDVGTFLQALVKLNYDGPIRAEPFNQPLNAMDNDAAVKATSQAMKDAFSKI